MTFTTERLELIVLSAEQLKVLTENLPALEKELNCHYEAEPLEGFFLKILKGQIPLTEQDPKNYAYHTFWLIVRKSDRIVVGSADFKRPPDENGRIEIGYGLGKAFEHHGYMTEAVKTMCQWAFEQPEVTQVIAETEPENTASHQVLKRCGFTLTQEKENLWWAVSK